MKSEPKKSVQKKNKKVRSKIGSGNSIKSKSTKKIRLGVNIDHCATLRQVRGGTTSYPDIPQMAELAKKGGADQITIHLREDRRHIQEKDVRELCAKRVLPINLEMACSPQMQTLALKYHPDWVCFVPEKRQELTTEGGLDVAKNLKRLSKMSLELQRRGIEVSMFIDPSEKQVRASYQAGAEAVEFHTGAWVHAVNEGRRQKAAKIYAQLKKASQLAAQLGLRVHAGHGLDYKTAAKIKSLPNLLELNIGHSLVCYALELGLEESVRRMAKILK